MAETQNSGLGYAVLVMAILAIGFAAVNSYVTFSKYSKVSELTGFGTSGYVNLTLATIVSVNFTQDTINWGAGSITTGQNNASLLVTDGGATVTRGNWSTTGMKPLAIENIGTVNVTLQISADKNATGLLSGSAGNRRYQINVSSTDAGACNGGAVNNVSIWVDPNLTSPGDNYCTQLGFLDTQDQVNISLILAVPYDGNTGTLSSTITATASVAP